MAPVAGGDKLARPAEGYSIILLISEREEVRFHSGNVAVSPECLGGGQTLTRCAEEILLETTYVHAYPQREKRSSKE